MVLKRLLHSLCAITLAIIVQASLADSARSQAVTVDAALLEQLQRLVEQQQEQLNRQAETIEALQTRVDQLDQTSTQTQAIASEAQSTANQAIDTAQKTSAGQLPDTVVTSGSERVKLAISGHINRAVNFADDGDKTRAFFVDNDTSNSRIRFVGTGQVTEDTKLGSRIEVAFSPNNSFDVSQDDQSTGDFIDVRKVEAFARNDTYGQLLFGKGPASADDTAEYDLSLVAGPIMYSGIADIVGGLQFASSGALTGVTVGDAFFNFDGNRQDRVRYDTPNIGPGLQLSASAGSSQRYDAALTWGGDYGDWSGVDIGPFTTLGAVSIREPNASGVDWRFAGSFSTLHNPTGLSLTVSGGLDSREASAESDPYNIYGKIGWDTSFFKFGQTGFGVDYTYNEHNSAQGDEGQSFGLAAIQLIENFGTELYAQFRLYDLDRAGGGVDDIVVGTVGARVKF